jgi:AAA15 family ATPase/GTPase
MLLRFSVANHRSIKDAQTLSLVASSLKDVEHGLIPSAAVPGGRLLPAAVIYGANASGKSNFIDAFRFVCRAVLRSHSRGEPGTSVGRHPYALDPASAEEPSIFRIDFLVDGVRHEYGCEVLDREFPAEWLYDFPNNRRQVLFERSNGNDFKFGRALKGHNRVIADLTRSDSLFISAAAQNDHEQLSSIAKFFQALDVASPTSVSGVSFKQEKIDERVIQFLGKIGTGVIAIRQTEREDSPQIRTIAQEFFAVLQRHMTDTSLSTSDKVFKTELGHRGLGGETIFFEFEWESDGTRRLLPLLVRVFRALDKGTPLLIDELDASLHTHACEAVVALFSSTESNRHGAQLIVTTHDTNLLHSPLLRRDQVWFTEKDAEGATKLFPLTDIRTRAGDNLEKGYLQGRYGAIPSVELLSELETVR